MDRSRTTRGRITAHYRIGADSSFKTAQDEAEAKTGKHTSYVDMNCFAYRFLLIFELDVSQFEKCISHVKPSINNNVYHCNRRYMAGYDISVMNVS